MTILRVTAAATVAVLAVILAAWCMWVAATHERPARHAPAIAMVSWWLGQVVFFGVAGLIAASLLGLIIGAVARMVAAG